MAKASEPTKPAEKPAAGASAAEAAPPAEKPAAAAEGAKGAAPAPEKRAVAPLILARWSESQFAQARHSIRPETGTPYEHVLDPSYLAHIVSKLNAGDVIEVRPAEGHYYAELFVWDKGTGWAQVSELVKLDRPAPSAEASSDKAFSIEFVDGPDKYRILRSADRRVMAKAFASREAAAEWLGANVSKIAA